VFHSEAVLGSGRIYITSNIKNKMKPNKKNKTQNSILHLQQFSGLPSGRVLGWAVRPGWSQAQKLSTQVLNPLSASVRLIEMS